MLCCCPASVLPPCLYGNRSVLRSKDGSMTYFFLFICRRPPAPSPAPPTALSVPDAALPPDSRSAGAAAAVAAAPLEGEGGLGLGCARRCRGPPCRAASSPQAGGRPPPPTQRATTTVAAMTEQAGRTTCVPTRSHCRLCFFRPGPPNRPNHLNHLNSSNRPVQASRPFLSRHLSGSPKSRRPRLWQILRM